MGQIMKKKSNLILIITLIIILIINIIVLSIAIYQNAHYVPEKELNPPPCETITNF